MNLKALVTLIVITSVSGCSNVQVYSQAKTTSTPSQINGIPFYVKTPKRVQETKYLRKQLAVVITLTPLLDDKPLPSKIVSVLPIYLPDSPESLVTLESLLNDFRNQASDGNWDSNVAADKAQGLVSKLIDYANRHVAAHSMISNTSNIKMVVSPKQYYISTRTPLFGSATATYKFSEDGTMTEATTTVTDDTAKTLLGLFPITGKLEKRWGLDDAEKSTSNAKKLIETLKKSHSLDGFPQSWAPKKSEFIIAAEAKNLKTLTILQRSNFISTDKIPDAEDEKDALTPITYDDGINGLNGAQLISQEEFTKELAAKDEKKPSKGYEIQGTITPPDVPKSTQD